MTANVTKVFTDFLTKTVTVSTGIFPNRRRSVTKDSAAERVISLKEVSVHDSAKDCWIVIYDRVYDVTRFIDEHPGGGELLLEYAGRDATTAFRGSNHSNDAINLLDHFFIGQLPVTECIFRKFGGYRMTDIPA